MKKTNRNRKGSAMLEAALITTPTLAMFVFILQMGVILGTQQYYMERARAGARYAATTTYNSGDTSNIKNYVCYGSATAPTGATSGLFGLRTNMVSVTRLGSSGTWNDRIQVQISGYSMASYIPWMSGTITGKTLVATAPAQSLGATN